MAINVNDVAVFVARGSDGSIDEAQSAVLFNATLTLFIEQERLESGSLGTAVDAVFDKHRGARINLPTLATYAAQELGPEVVTVENHAAMIEKLQNYVRTNAGETGKYAINKGKNGGVSRRSDTPAAPATTVTTVAAPKVAPVAPVAPVAAAAPPAPTASGSAPVEADAGNGGKHQKRKAS